MMYVFLHDKLRNVRVPTHLWCMMSESESDQNSLCLSSCAWQLTVFEIPLHDNFASAVKMYFFGPGPGPGELASG